MLQIDVACLSLVEYEGLLLACVNRLRGGGMGYDLRHTDLTTRMAKKTEFGCSLYL